MILDTMILNTMILMVESLVFLIRKIGRIKGINLNILRTRRNW